MPAGAMGAITKRTVIDQIFRIVVWRPARRFVEIEPGTSVRGIEPFLRHNVGQIRF